MSVLEWTLVLELVLIATAGIFWLMTFFVGKEDPDDPITLFYETFWRVLLRRRARVRSVVSELDEAKAKKFTELKDSGDVEGMKELLSEESGGKYDFDDMDLLNALEDSSFDPTPDLLDSGTSNAPATGNFGAGIPQGEKPVVAIVNVKVVPYAPTNELVSVQRDGITVQVTCGPEEGQANKTVLDAVAAAVNVKSYQVTLLKGHYKPLKVVQVAGYDQDEMEVKLAEG